MKLRFSVSFPRSVYGRLSVLADSLVRPPAQVLGDAINLYWRIASERAQGHTVLIRRGDALTEIEIPSLVNLPQCWLEGPGSSAEPEEMAATGGTRGEGPGSSREVSGAAAGR